MAQSIPPTPWYTYIVVNHTRKEIYVGCVEDLGTGDDPVGWEQSVGEHWRVQCSEIEHWDCASHGIRFTCSVKRSNHERARDLAVQLRSGHDLHRYCPTAAVLLRDGFVLLGN